MAEEDVCYASVVIKSKMQLQPRVKQDNETVYDEVKVNKEPAQEKEAEVEKQNESVQQTPDQTVKIMEKFEVEKQNESVQKTHDTTVKEAERLCRYQQLCCCFGILCVISVLCIIGVCVYFRVSTASELNQLKSSQQVLLEENQNLTNLNNKLSSDYKNLMIQFDNLTTASITLENKITMLTVENYNLTKAYMALENKITMLTVENYNLTVATTILENNITTLTVENYNLTTASVVLKNNITTLTKENRNLTLLNEKLMEERKKLTELIKNMEETWNELNVSRAQWSIDQYCPKNNARSCTSCQRGWNYQLSSCYAYNDAEYAYRTNWNGARENCKKMNSDLTVVSDNAEKIYVKTLSPVIGDITGYWIGLRAVGGKWKWLDGSDLTNQAWIQQPATDGQCVTSLQTREWTSVSCTEKYNWICEKKALSV
ncbi:C-type lectin domain family 4 member M-like isoform X2 [Poecilia formosa]|uniref:C-type lectin domain family 4 member M-like isoform X2 n=1 Tax=Poecilia formosa TaxID=48698 RepID=UPI0007B7C441|nr:PREDICTED: C-type lectin domain family 4 member M-like isoform X2 [Poecilia formosa]